MQEGDEGRVPTTRAEFESFSMQLAEIAPSYNAYAFAIDPTQTDPALAVQVAAVLEVRDEGGRVLNVISPPGFRVTFTIPADKLNSMRLLNHIWDEELDKIFLEQAPSFSGRSSSGFTLPGFGFNPATPSFPYGTTDFFGFTFSNNVPSTSPNFGWTDTFSLTGSGRGPGYSGVEGNFAPGTTGGTTGGVGPSGSGTGTGPGGVGVGASGEAP